MSSQNVTQPVPPTVSQVNVSVVLPTDSQENVSAETFERDNREDGDIQIIDHNEVRYIWKQLILFKNITHKIFSG